VPTVAEVVEWVERRYPPALVEPWDAIGLVCGRPEAPIAKILVTVDVTPRVVAAAVDGDVDFILAHHPLMLTPQSSIAATEATGKMLHDLIEANCALMTAHTNADSAIGGVSDALADALGMSGHRRPLEPIGGELLDKVVVMVPVDAAQGLVDALSVVGAGAIGNYDRCAFIVEGLGTFRPLEGANPHIGTVGEVEEVGEVRVEMVVARHSRASVIAAIHQAHPYEVPAFDFTAIEVGTGEQATGLGRIGSLLEPMTLKDFADVVAAELPATAQGIRVAGDGDKVIRTVAVCGGSGDSLMSTATQAGADVFVTADLKHHRVSDHVAADGCAIIDVAHWSSEFPWTEQAAAQLQSHFADTVSVEICRLVTDPWQHHVPSSSPRFEG